MTPLRRNPVTSCATTFFIVILQRYADLQGAINVIYMLARNINVCDDFLESLRVRLIVIQLLHLKSVLCLKRN